MKAPIKPKLKNEWDDRYVNKKIAKRDFMVESYIRTSVAESTTDCKTGDGDLIFGSVVSKRK